MHKILIVDDALFMRRLIREALEPVGFEVIGEAENGLEALKLFESMKPDLMTLDIIMPEMDGIQVLQEIRKTDKEAKIVMITAVDQRDCMLKAMSLGVSDFIVKPFDDTRVVSAVEKAIGRSGN